MFFDHYLITRRQKTESTLISSLVAMAQGNHQQPPLAKPRTWPRNKQPQKEFSYQDIRLFREEQLGTGSYGMVCKATVGDLTCAAKILHMTFFQLNDLSPGTPSRMMTQFHQECELMNSIRHPCIVQFLATYRDPETRLPVLLMELMDESLTKFLESSVESQIPVFYHIQVNICHDVAMAVSFLHTHGIIHRDLSSNNILMIARSRAKVTDFGMSRLTDVNPRMTPLTQCPGTMVYMSPEALRTPPSYTEKLDIFSLGVLMLQIATCNFPNPKDPKETIRDPRLGVIEKPVPELERRKEDIDRVHIDHPLRHMALNCLADEPADRAHASHICRQLAILKGKQPFLNSMAEQQESYTAVKRLERAVLARDEEIQRLRDEVRQKMSTIAMIREEGEEEKQRALAARDRTIASLKEDCERMHRELVELRMDNRGMGNVGSPMSIQNDSILGQLYARERERERERE